jgi:amino acid adenylation domain-containing protein
LSDNKRPQEQASTNFAALLWRASANHGDRPAIRHRGETTTYAELRGRAAVIASALASEGVGEGDTVAVLARSPRDAAAAFFAALAVGAVGINLNELYKPRQLEFALSHSGAKILVAGRDVLKSMPRPVSTSAHVLILEDLEDSVAVFDPVRVEPDSPAQITYTSGSTGQPKGVLMSHANLWAGVRVVAGYLGLRSDDRIASLLPFSFVYGFNQLTTSLYVGATLVVERSTLVQEIVATLRRERITVLAAVPPLWQQLLASSAFRDQRIDSLRILTNAGGRLPPESVRALRIAQPQAQLFLMYGLTEVFRSTYLPPDEVDTHPDSMGRAVPESVVYVVTESGTLARTGETGELVHGGPSVALGYVRDEETTRRVFKPNPFPGPGQPARVVYSGDLVRRDDEGRLYYVGRRDRMIKTMGFRVSPDEISDVLQASGVVTEAAVVTEPDEQRGERIIACVVLRENQTVEDLRRFCGVELPRYMQPVRYVAMAEIPRNASGKHDIIQLKLLLSAPAPETATN